MIPQLEIAIAALFLAIGAAGAPLEPARIAGAMLLCAVVWRSGKFVGALSMAAVILGAWWQHGQFRLTALFAAVALGLCAHLFYRRPRACTAIMAIGAIAGLAFLFLG